MYIFFKYTKKAEKERYLKRKDVNMYVHTLAEKNRLSVTDLRNVAF